MPRNIFTEFVFHLEKIMNKITRCYFLSWCMTGYLITPTIYESCKSDKIDKLSSNYLLFVDVLLLSDK